MEFCNSVQFPKFLCPQLVSSNSLKNVVICLSASLLAESLVKITLLVQNVSSPVGSILEGCWRKVPFSDELEEPCLRKLVSATLLSGPGLLEKLILLPHYCFLWRRALVTGLRFPFTNRFEQLFSLLTGFNSFSNVMLNFISK